MNKKTINKVLAALKAKPIPVPSNKEGYFAWLNSYKNGSKK